MYILNFIGLVLGYLGSIMLSVGILKSRQEVIDEEKPFWGPNPFRIRSTLGSRILGFSGMIALVAGFATTTVANAFIYLIRIRDVWLAILVIMALLLFAYAIIFGALYAKKRAHINAKNKYYYHELLDTIRALYEEPSEEDVPGKAKRDLEDIRKHYLDTLSRYSSDIGYENRQQLGRLLTNITDAKDAAAIKAFLEIFLQEDQKETNKQVAVESLVRK